MNLSNEQLNELDLKEGQQITVIKINSICFAIKMEVIFINVEGDTLAVKVAGEENTKHLAIDTETLMFDSWRLPFKVESEYEEFSACSDFNLVGEAEVIKKYVDEKNLNKHFAEYNKQMVVAVAKEEGKEDVFTPLYS